MIANASSSTCTAGFVQCDSTVRNTAVSSTVTFPCIPAGDYELRLYISSGSPPVWRRPLTIRSRRSVTRIGELGDPNCSAICAAPSMAVTTSPAWAADVINPPESSRRYSAGREVYSNSGSEVVTAATMRAVCAALPTNTTMIEVVMGDVHDFFRPVPGHTVCEMLQSNRLHEYYDGDNGWVAPSYNAHPNFGGSLDGWPRRESATGGDNRRFLSFWYYRRNGAYAVTESLTCGGSSLDGGDDAAGSADTPAPPQCAIYGRPDLPRCPPFSAPDPIRWRTSSGVLVGTVDVQARPSMLHEHAHDPGNVSCADVNGAWPLNETECWEAARSNNLSVSSRGHSWVDRPAGCWMHQNHVVNAVTGERRDRVFYNTNTNRSSICRADHDHRPGMPGVDVDQCRGFPLVCGVRDSMATVTYVNEGGTGPGNFAHLYSYANRSAAAAACVRSGADGLCSKVDIEGYSLCAHGWMTDFLGYWMQGPLPPNTGCGGTSTGYRDAGDDERLAGAYCCVSATPAASSPAAANCVSGAELDTWYSTATPGVATRSLCCPAGHFRVGDSGVCRYDEHSEDAACALYGNYGTMRCPELCPAGLQPTWTPDVRPGGCCSSSYSVSYQNWSQPFSINAIAANSPSRSDSDGPLLCDTCPTGNCYLRSATDSDCNVVVERINQGAEGTNFYCDDWHRLRSSNCGRDVRLLEAAVGDIDLSCEGTDGVSIVHLASCAANLARLNAFLPIDINPDTLLTPGGSQLDGRPWVCGTTFAQSIFESSCPASNWTRGVWAAGNAVAGQWVQLDLGSTMSVAGVVVQGGGTARSSSVTRFNVSTGLDGVAFHPVGGPYEGTPGADTKISVRFAEPRAARFVRLIVDDWVGRSAGAAASMRVGVIPFRSEIPGNAGLECDLAAMERVDMARDIAALDTHGFGGALGITDDASVSGNASVNPSIRWLGELGTTEADFNGGDDTYDDDDDDGHDGDRATTTCDPGGALPDGSRRICACRPVDNRIIVASVRCPSPLRWGSETRAAWEGWSTMSLAGSSSTASNDALLELQADDGNVPCASGRNVDRLIPPLVPPANTWPAGTTLPLCCPANATLHAARDADERGAPPVCELSSGQQCALWEAGGAAGATRPQSCPVLCPPGHRPVASFNEAYCSRDHAPSCSIYGGPVLTPPYSVAEVHSAPVDADHPCSTSRLPTCRHGKWHGAAFDPVTGKVYSAPIRASGFLVFDPATDTSAIVGTVPEPAGAEVPGWYGSIVHHPPSGAMVGIPYLGTNVLALDTVLNTTFTISANISSAESSSGTSWYSAAYDPGTTKIFAAPYSAANVLVIDVTHGTTAALELASPGSPAYSYYGCVYDPVTAKMYGVPARAPAVLVVDPSSNVTDVTALPVPPLAISLRSRWVGGVYDPETGKIFGVPYDGDFVLVIAPQLNTTALLTLSGERWSTTVESLGQWAFGVHDPVTNRIYCAPSTADAVLVIDTVLNTTDSWSLFVSDVTRKYQWHGAAYHPPTGKIVMMPDNSDTVLRLIPDPSIAPTVAPSTAPTLAPSTACGIGQQYWDRTHRICQPCRTACPAGSTLSCACNETHDIMCFDDTTAARPNTADGCRSGEAEDDDVSSVTQADSVASGMGLIIILALVGFLCVVGMLAAVLFRRKKKAASEQPWDKPSLRGRSNTMEMTDVPYDTVAMEENPLRSASQRLGNDDRPEYAAAHFGEHLYAEVDDHCPAGNPDSSPLDDYLDVWVAPDPSGLEPAGGCAVAYTTPVVSMASGRDDAQNKIDPTYALVLDAGTYADLGSGRAVYGDANTQEAGDSGAVGGGMVYHQAQAPAPGAGPEPMYAAPPEEDPNVVYVAPVTSNPDYAPSAARTGNAVGDSTIPTSARPAGQRGNGC